MIFGTGIQDRLIDSETFKIICKQLQETSEDIGYELTLERAKKLALGLINREGLDAVINVLFGDEVYD